MLGRNGTLSRSSIAVFALAIFVFFQNCLGSGDFVSSKLGMRGATTSPSTDTANRGGGDGYDGKIYVRLADGKCADEGLVESRVVMKDGKALYVRKNCADVPAGATVEADVSSLAKTEVTVDGKKLTLESVPATEAGVSFTSDVGDYAPSIFTKPLGPATGIQAAPLGDDYVLSVQGVGGIMELSSIRLRLFKRDGMILTETDSIQETVTGLGTIESNPISNLAPLGASSAVLFLRKTIHEESAPAYRYAHAVMLVVREGNKLRLAQGFSGAPLIGGSRIAGQPIDAERLLVWNTENDGSGESLRVISAAGQTLALGAELKTPAPAAEIFGTPAIVRVPGSDVFRVVRGGLSNLSEDRLSSSRALVSGTSVSLETPPASYAQSSPGATDPVGVGTDASAYVVYMARSEVTDRTLYYGRIQNGAYTEIGVLAPEQDAMGMAAFWPYVKGLMSMTSEGTLPSMAAADNLVHKGRTFMPLGRVLYFDADSTRPKIYNFIDGYALGWGGLPVSLGTGRLFRSGATLIATGRVGEDVVLRVFSTPE